MTNKATLLLLAAVALMGTVAACSSGPAAPAGTASEIADKVFAEAGVDPFGPKQNLEKAQDREFYLGAADYPAFADSAVVLPMISIDTRVLYVIKAASSDDVDKMMTQLEENIDPNRLVCVTFSLDDVVIDSRGDVVFMTINSNEEQRLALAEGFKAIE